MVKFYVPEIGDIITLSDDWRFDLYFEGRNFKFIDLLIANGDLESFFLFEGEITEEYNDGSINKRKYIEDPVWKQLFYYGMTWSLIRHPKQTTINSSRLDGRCFPFYNSNPPKIITIECKKNFNSLLSNIIPTTLETENYNGVNQVFLDRHTTVHTKIDVLNIPKNSFGITLPKGTKLKVDRIYIRKGSSDYSSISFIIESSPNNFLTPKKKIRFWAKLSDCNQINFV